MRGGQMTKAKRKPRPAMPEWFWLGQDGCWFCASRNCNSCGVLKRSAKKMLPKKYKGKRSDPPREG